MDTEKRAALTLRRDAEGGTSARREDGQFRLW